MKIINPLLLLIYLLALIWLVIFKLSFDLSVLPDVGSSLNLVPFANYSSENIRELIYNFLAFVPLGLLVSASFKNSRVFSRLFLVFVTSFVFETIQYVYGIGVSDITDLISNTAGGLLGILIYESFRSSTETSRLNKIVAAFGAVLILLTATLGIAMKLGGIKYRSTPPEGLQERQRQRKPSIN